MENIIFKSTSYRFDLICERLKEEKIDYRIMDFDDDTWIDYDYSNVKAIFFQPVEKTSSNNPNCLFSAHINLKHLADRYPDIKIFPDPNLLKYFNDKYQQFLFLKSKSYSIPHTVPISEVKDLDKISTTDFPVVLKNRHGASGAAVFLVNTKKELKKFLLFALGVPSFKIASKVISFKRILINIKKFFIEPLHYLKPQLFIPLLVQQKLNIDRDLRVIVVDGKVFFAFWRLTPPKKWKSALEGGGTGVWSHIPEKIIEICEKLARDLEATWIAIDIVYDKNQYYILEFSPCWHHWFYKEKENFEYRDDYNIDVSPKEGHDYEGMLVKTLFS